MITKSLLINRKKVSYLDEGIGPSILLIHGWAACKESFMPLINASKKKYRLMAPNLPGNGDSESLDNKHSLKNYSKFLELFIKELKLKKPHIMGTSLGGTLAFLYAIKNPNNIDKVIVQAPVFYWKQLLRSSILPAICFKPYLKPIVKLLSKSKVVQNQYFYSLEKHTLEKVVPKIRKNVSEKQLKETNKVISIIKDKVSNCTSKQAITEFGISILGADLRDELRHLQKEILILWGKDDEILDPKWALELKNILPNSKYTEIKKATHFAILEKPNEIAREIEKFLSVNNK